MRKQSSRSRPSNLPRLLLLCGVQLSRLSFLAKFECENFNVNALRGINHLAVSLGITIIIIIMIISVVVVDVALRSNSVLVLFESDTTQ